MEICSQELEDSQLLLNGPGFERSSFPKSNPTVADSLPNVGPPSLTSGISEKQILLFGEDESMSLAEGSPASHSVLPGSDEARTMTVTSGRQCGMLSQKSGLLGLFVKTFLVSSVWGNSKECVHLWKTSVTKSNRSLFQLARWEQDTRDTGCSLLPTPTIPNGGRVNPEGTSATGRKPDGGKAQMDLGHAIKMELSPTPSAGNFNDGETLESWEKRRQKNKAKGINGNGHGTPLAIQAKLSAAPSARDWKNGKASPTAERNSRPLNEQTINNIVSEDSGMLNPRFVEEYQGFPIDHTALKPSATLSFHKSLSRSSRRSRKSKT